MTTLRARRSPTRWGIALLLVGVGGGAIATSGFFIAATYQGATYRCMVAGPWSPLALGSEAGDVVQGRFNPWSLGRECEWRRADAVGTVITDSGAPGAILFLAAVPLAGVGLLSGGLVSGIRRPRT